ncbi:MAG TPA: M28 family peptidase [Gemmatimonadaceae bacterium]|nr:M28 family peptidase [Gemmatimonadaceae bacterium]
MTGAVAIGAPSSAWAQAQSGAPTPSTAPADSAWWRHVTRLAHDSMRGREAGTPEHRKAAEYVARELARAGLQPAGDSGHGFLQPVRLLERRLDESASRLAVVRDGREEAIALGTDAVLSARFAPTLRVDAPVVFVGYGLQIPSHGHDDLAGLDLRGKVVAYINAPPRGIPASVIADARSRSWEALRAAGAVGTILFYGAVRRATEVPWSRVTGGRLTSSMMLADTTLDPLGGRSQLSAAVRAELAERFFAGSPHRFADVVALADSGLPMPRFGLPVSVRAVTQTTMRTAVSDNVAGLLPGTDPALRDEVVVLTAHLDHEGIAHPVGGDSIYNGAMDNASGTAALLEVASALGRAAREGRGPRRSVAFVAVTAEEKGLLGSRYYARYPTVGARRVVANINTDMFLPIMPFKRLIVGGLEESDLADDVRKVGNAMGIEVMGDPEPERNSFVRSDQYSFIRAGIPALSLKLGFLRDSPEHELVRRWRVERYHAPSDDLTQPIDHAAANQFVELYARLVREVADRPTRPRWNADSPFRRYAEPRAGATP